MLSHLPPRGPSVSGRFRMLGMPGVLRMIRAVMLVQLLGSIRPFEFMALTGNAGKRNNHDQQGKKFHRRAS